MIKGLEELPKQTLRLLIGVGAGGKLGGDLPKFLMLSVRAMMTIGIMAACRSVANQFLRHRSKRFFFTIVFVCLARPAKAKVAMLLQTRK